MKVTIEQKETNQSQDDDTSMEARAIHIKSSNKASEVTKHPPSTLTMEESSPTVDCDHEEAVMSTNAVASLAVDFHCEEVDVEVEPSLLEKGSSQSQFIEEESEMTTQSSTLGMEESQQSFDENENENKNENENRNENKNKNENENETSLAIDRSDKEERIPTYIGTKNEASPAIDYDHKDERISPNHELSLATEFDHKEMEPSCDALLDDSSLNQSEFIEEESEGTTAHSSTLGLEESRQSFDENKKDSEHKHKNDSESEASPAIGYDQKEARMSIHNNETSLATEFNRKEVEPSYDTSLEKGINQSKPIEEESKATTHSSTLEMEETQQSFQANNRASLAADCRFNEVRISHFDSFEEGTIQIIEFNKDDVYESEATTHFSTLGMEESEQSFETNIEAEQSFETKTKASLAIDFDYKKAVVSRDNPRDEGTPRIEFRENESNATAHFSSRKMEEDSSIESQQSFGSNTTVSLVIEYDETVFSSVVSKAESEVTTHSSTLTRDGSLLKFFENNREKSLGIGFDDKEGGLYCQASSGKRKRRIHPESNTLGMERSHHQSKHKEAGVSSILPRPSHDDRGFGIKTSRTMTTDQSRQLSSSRFRNHGRHNTISSMDLIYGHGAAGTYFAGGSMGAASSDHRSATTISRGDQALFRDSQRNQKLRISSKNAIEMKALRIEAFFYNRGMEIALGVLFLALNYLVAAHGAYQFTEAGGFTTDNDILRITLPIARAGGRLVTFNCAVILLTSCKCFWTLVRTHLVPIIPIGFPIDDIMPKYHRYVALTIIVAGCIIHTLPHIVNYASKAITIDHNGLRIWTYGDGYATKQLLVTGTLLTIIFSTFFFTTLKAFRKTAAGFRWFWFFHVGGIATAYPLLLVHGTCRGHPVFFYFALVPLALYLLDISMRRYKISTANIIRWKIDEDQGQQITELVVERPRNFVYTPGQYVELRFLPISGREWHPFTIASAPNEKGNGKNGKQELVFYIKNAGRWTGALFDYASAFDLSRIEHPLQIDIRGPHGAPAMNYFEYKHILVIGSGVGVAPLLSIWKYLVARGKEIAEMKKYKHRTPAINSMPHRSTMDAPRNSHMTAHTLDLESNDSDVAFGESWESAAKSTHSRIRSKCILLQTILESMTVSLGLFALFVLGETFTIVLHMFGCVLVANSLGILLSVIALIIYGSTIFVSTTVLGWSEYFKRFNCWLECSILFVDFVALWFSIRSCFETLAQQQQYRRENTTIYLSVFGYVVVLHVLRIFHMFYVTLKPATTLTTDHVNKPDTLTPSNLRASAKGEIYSIQGIFINRKYSNMRFAARDLLPPILKEGLSDLFSMEFYGTREIDTRKNEEELVTDIMGSEELDLDVRSSLFYSKQNKQQNREDFFCSGRPDWNRIFLKAIARAHCTNEEGDSVGVFFCGSPAIAKDLQAEAKRVTAKHQFATKHFHGKACKCKLIVHSENF